jgi:hypothetical protein
MSQSTTTDTSSLTLSSAAITSLLTSTDYPPGVAAASLSQTPLEPIPVNSTSTVTITSSTFMTITESPTSQSTSLSTSDGKHQLAVWSGLPGCVVLAWVGILTYKAFCNRS